MWYDKIYPFANDIIGKDTRTQKRLAQAENNRQWQDVFNRLVSLAVNLFEWEGLPETCDQYFFETCLLWAGRACVIYDNERNAYFSLNCVPASNVNFYYENTYYRAISVGYSQPFKAVTHYNKNVDISVLDTKLTEQLGVVCYDNVQQYPMIETLTIYTDKIVDAMRTLDVIAKQLKIPAIITTDEQSKTSVQEAIRNIDTNLIAIMAKRDLAKQLVDSKSLPTGAQGGNLEIMWKHLHNLWSEALTALGINNMSSSDKKERLITDEVNSNNDFIIENLNYRLDQRKHFCENMKACFGLDITVKKKHEGENRNGDIYDDPERVRVDSGDESI